MKRWIREWDVSLASGILVVFVILSTLQVVFRYLLNAPLDWTEEMAALLLVWMTFIGAIVAARRDDHIKVEIVDELIKNPKVLLLANSFYRLCIIAYLMAVTYGGILLWHRITFQRTPVMRIPLRYVSLIVPISSVFMAVHYAGHLVKSLRRREGTTNGS